MNSPDGLVDAIPMPCLLVDRAERVLASNVAARTLLGRGMVGRNYATFVRQPEALDAIDSCLRGEAPEQGQFLSNDGAQDTTFIVHCRFVPDIGWQERGGALVCLEDITHVQQSEQMRRDFVANVSHELRTPLTAVLGFIETLRGPAKNDPAAQDRFLKIMEGEAERMNRLVGDLLSLSRVEDTQRVRPTQNIAIDALTKSVLHSLRPVADEAGVVFETRFDESEVFVEGDDDQLRQVMTNLIENAIKYGGAGGRVEVSLSYVPQDRAVRGPSARISVRDFGPGIEEQHLPRLTERFYRVDNHRSRELGGTGLGLAIVKHIISRHRGRLRVESEIGKGSVFTVILPARSADVAVSTK